MTSSLKCKMCGGSLQAHEDEGFAVCEYCGAKAALPRVGDEQRALLYNRANHFRMLGEFDQALDTYAEIVRQDPQDAEAYFCLALCRHGIIYVEDPATHERVPTCQRLGYTLFTQDADYCTALQLSAGYAQSLYRQEGERIAAVQKGILAISSREAPYEVFLCYKETSPTGQRTQASLLAQDIYTQLTREKHRVFFARITLERKLGEEYEPYIFAALHSASVMLVVGTAKEEFEAPWVANEWKRFLALAKEDDAKILIPCYRDMDAYELPAELLPFQGQDMSKIGAMQDLLHGVEKLLGGPDSAPSSSAHFFSKIAADAQPLLERAFILIEDQEWAKADQLLEQVLNRDPKCARAYIGKLLVSRRKAKVRDLFSCTESFADDVNYRHALEYGTARETAVLRQTCNAYEARLEQEQRQREAQLEQERRQRETRARQATLRQQQQNEALAAEETRVRQLLADSRPRLEALRQEQARLQRRQPLAKLLSFFSSFALGVFGLLLVLVTFTLLFGQLSQPSLAVRGLILVGLWLAWLAYCRSCLQSWRCGTARQKYTKPIVLLLAAVVVTSFALMMSIAVASSNYSEAQYAQATAAMEQGDYAGAAALFNDAAGYQDAREQYRACYYQLGLQAMSHRDYETAQTYFTESADYRDSAEKCLECLCLANSLPADSNVAKEQAPWFSVDETGALRFDESVYTGGGVLAVPPVFDGHLVTAVASYAFEDCKTLTEITVPKTVLRIGDYAFKNCTALTTLKIEDGLQEPGSHMVVGAENLQDIYLPATLTSLQYDSLRANYRAHVTIHYNGTQAQWEALVESSPTKYNYSETYLNVLCTDTPADPTTEE